MYNRYVPQPDGSYRRNSVREPMREPRRAPTPVPPEPEPEPPCEPPTPPCQSGQPCTHMPPPRRSSPGSHPSPPPGIGVGSFLKQLLPKDFDTEDLLVVILLLLMAGDCREDQNSALLTLALYLFL